jgi:hypothetical protein
MSWTDSRIFQAWVVQPMLRQGTAPTGGTGEIVTNDTVTAALFNNTGTPDRTVAVGSTGYNTGQWVTANEVTGASEWVAGGRNLASKTITPSAGVVTFTAANLAGSATVTMANIFGTLVYDNTITGGTVADQGICYNYFGGSQSVTAGTFSVNWNASGIFSFTV